MTEPTDALPTIRGAVLDVAERAGKTFAQALLAYFGAGALDVLHADWGNGLSVAAGAAVISVLTSLASLPIGKGGTASLTAAVVPAAVYDALASTTRTGRHAAADPLEQYVADIKAPADDFPHEAYDAWAEHPRSKPKADALIAAVEAMRTNRKDATS